MIDYLLAYLNNYFPKTHDRITLTFSGSTISGISGQYLVGQYVNIYDSVLNDGTYKITQINGSVLTVDATLQAETVDCSIFGLAIPKQVLDLVSKVTIDSEGILSESQGNRSVTYSGPSWQAKYHSTLSAYRCVYDERERWLKCGRRTRLYSK
jgi:hypothetical protein